MTGCEITMTGCKIAQNHCSKLTLIRDFGSPLQLKLENLDESLENLMIGEALNMTNKKVTSTHLLSVQHFLSTSTSTGSS